MRSCAGLRRVAVPPDDPPECGDSTPSMDASPREGTRLLMHDGCCGIRRSFDTTSERMMAGSTFCLTNPPGFNPHGIPADHNQIMLKPRPVAVGFNSLHRVIGSLGIQLRFHSFPFRRLCGFQVPSVVAFGAPSDKTRSMRAARTITGPSLHRRRPTRGTDPRDAPNPEVRRQTRARSADMRQAAP